MVKIGKITSEEIIIGTAVAVLSYVILTQLTKNKPNSNNAISSNLKQMRIENSGAKLRKLPTDIVDKFKVIAGKDYDSFVNSVNSIGLEPIIAIRQMYHESSFSPDVMSCKKSSPAGAQGIAQFMPSTWKTYGQGNPCNISDSLKAYPKLMSKLLTKFNGRVDLALAGYNWGYNRDTLKNALKQETPFIKLKSALPTETYNYVASILQP